MEKKKAAKKRRNTREMNPLPMSVNVSGLDRFLRIEVVAQLAHCSIRHIHDEIARKNLRAFKPGKRLLFDPDEIEKWIKRKAA